YDSVRKVTVLFGGEQSSGYSNDTWEWNGTKWTQKAPSVSPSRRCSHSLAYDAARGVSVMFGGFDGTHDNEAWERDGTTWKRRGPTGIRLAPPTTAFPSKRFVSAMAYDAARGVSVLFGGYDGRYDRETWEWDGFTWSQQDDTEFSRPDGHAMAYDRGRG